MDCAAAVLYDHRALAVLDRNGMRIAAASGATDVDRLWSDRMAAAQAGDRVAYQALLRDCVPLVRRIVRRTGVRPDRTDDVVQDVLMTVHRARQTYDPGRSFTAWLGAIARRRAIDDLRHRGRLERRELSDEAAYGSHPADAASPEDAWERSEQSDELQDAVARLPDAQREAVEALALRQLSLSEAAAQTGRSKGALKVNLHRALKALRGRFDRTG